MLDISKDQWRSIDSYPYDYNNASIFWNPAVVYAYSSYFYFGGSATNLSTKTIARLDGSSYKWSKVGQLNEGRFGHNAILLNDIFLVVGGRYTKKTEKCEYIYDQMVCHSQTPSLTEYAFAPELMIMSDYYCS